MDSAGDEPIPATGPAIGVVAGAAIIESGRLLAAQRGAPAALRGLWELPGGKVEPGEGSRDAAVRECREELGVKVEPYRRVGGDWPLSNGYVMRVWLCRLVEGIPEAREHLELRWLTGAQLPHVDWIPADLPIVEALRQHLAAGPAK